MADKNSKLLDEILSNLATYHKMSADQTKLVDPVLKGLGYEYPRVQEGTSDDATLGSYDPEKNTINYQPFKRPEQVLPHEATHLLQNSGFISAFNPDYTDHSSYDYGGPQGLRDIKSIDSLGSEQMADVVGDWASKHYTPWERIRNPKTFDLIGYKRQEPLSISQEDLGHYAELVQQAKNRIIEGQQKQQLEAGDYTPTYLDTLKRIFGK